MTIEPINDTDRPGALETLLAVTKYMQAITLLAEALENDYVAEELAPECTEEFLGQSNIKLNELQELLRMD